MDFKVEVTQDHTKELEAALRMLADTEVAVGYPEGATKEREAVTNTVNGASVVTPAGPLSNAEIAYIQDRGSPAKNIPPRPFLAPGIESASAEIDKQLARTAKAALEGNSGEAKRGFEGVGIEAVSGVRNKLTQGPFKGLSDRTLELRKRRGFKGTKPLIQSGQLRMATNYEVRRRT